MLVKVVFHTFTPSRKLFLYVIYATASHNASKCAKRADGALWKRLGKAAGDPFARFSHESPKM
jgi:hypothetical protein